MNLKWLKAISTGVMVAGLMAPLPMMAQAGTVDRSISAPADGAAHAWTQEQLMSSTVHEAWVLSGRNEDQFFEMVRELSAVSAQKRGLTLPDSQEAGVKAGNWIKKEARRDPDQLLYAVVDKAVSKTGVKNTTATK
ncbi:hypothetical protein BH10ACI4_BH10ACI4_31110 [soil metagenome]